MHSPTLRTRPALVLVTVLLSTLTFPLTITGASVALPGMRADLGAGLAALQWVINGYNTAFAGFLVFTGSLADVLGTRRVFAAGVALFCLGGVVSACAEEVLLLNIARAFAGVGAAAAVTGGSSILATTFDGPARARAFGLLGTVLGAGLAFGPTLSGLLVDHLGWRAVFAVPAAVAGLVLLLVPFLPGQRPDTARRIDWAGAGLFTGALVLLVFAVGEGPALGFTHPLILAGFAVALVFGVLLPRVERRRADPMFDLSLLGNRRFLGFATAAGVLMGLLVPLLVYLPSYLITVIGLDAGQAGIQLLMLTAPTVVLPALGAVLARRLPVTVLVPGVVAMTGLGVLLLTTIGPDSGVFDLLAPFLLIGTGVGLSNGVLDGLAIGSVPADRAGTAAGMFNTSRLATETVALAVCGAALAGLSGGTLAGDGFTGALQVVCFGLAGFALLATVSVTMLVRPQGSAGRGLGGVR